MTRPADVRAPDKANVIPSVLFLQPCVNERTSVQTGLLCLTSNLSISTAPCSRPAKKEKCIHIQTKPSAEAGTASRSPSSVASACLGAATAPPTATAGVCMGAGAASSPPAPGPPTGRTAGTPARSMSWRRSKLAAKNSVQMLTLTLKSCCVMSVFKEILMVAMRLNVWRCLVPPAGPAPHRWLRLN